MMKKYLLNFFVLMMTLLVSSCGQPANTIKLNAGWQLYEYQMYMEFYFLSDSLYLYGQEFGRIPGMTYQYDAANKKLKVFKAGNLFLDADLLTEKEDELTFFNAQTEQKIFFYKINGTDQIKDVAQMEALLECYDYRMFDYIIHKVEGKLDKFKDSAEFIKMKEGCE